MKPSLYQTFKVDGHVYSTVHYIYSVCIHVWNKVLGKQISVLCTKIKQKLLSITVHEMAS